MTTPGRNGTTPSGSLFQFARRLSQRRAELAALRALEAHLREHGTLPQRQA